MATIDMKSGKITDSARVLPDDRDSQTPVVDLSRPRDDLAELTSWVVSRCRMWRDHRRANYELLWDQYERLWRGLWTVEDKNRKSERSMLVTPGLGEAVENIVAEVEEALFGRGDSFDLKAKFDASEDAKQITDDNKNKLKEDLGNADFNSNVGEALINGAVYGTGIGEILVETFMLREIAASVGAAYSPAAAMPMAEPQGIYGGSAAPEMLGLGMEMPGLGMPMVPTMSDLGSVDSNAGPSPLLAPTMQPGVGSVPLEAKVIEREVNYACMYSVNPRNFLIEPTARTIDKALGVGIEEYVGSHLIRKGQKDGTYRKVDVGTSAGDTQLGPDRQVENEYVFDKVHVIRYYGLVPKHLLFPPSQTVDLSVPDAVETPVAGADVVEEVVDLANMNADGSMKSVEPIDSEMVEAIIVIANESVCIKADENPYLMKDRPVVAFPWDIVPGRFYGRGVCEKGMVPQRVMDAEMRARIDALAYISAPMMAMDASRLPRGFQLTVRPGKSILTNGDPNTILRPMHFGQLEQSTFTHTQQLDQMIQRATGSLDVISLASRAGGDSRSGSTSMMLSGIVKRHKRTLMGFIDRFYVPSLRKILWRNMQYYPERYTPRNWNFVASSTMGIIQREYETQNLVQLLNTMEPQSPEYKMLLMGVVSNTGLTHRREIIEMLKKSIDMAQQAQSLQQGAAADPQTAAMQAQLGQLQIQLQIAETQAKIGELTARTNLQNVKAQNATLEPGFRQMEIATKGIYQVQADQQDRAFKQRLAMTDTLLRARDITSNERIAQMQSRASVASEAIKARGSAAAARASAPATAPAPQPVRVPVPVPVPVRPQPQFYGRGVRLLA